MGRSFCHPRSELFFNMRMFLKRYTWKGGSSATSPEKWQSPLPIGPPPPPTAPPPQPGPFPLLLTCLRGSHCQLLQCVSCLHSPDSTNALRFWACTLAVGPDGCQSVFPSPWQPSADSAPAPVCSAQRPVASAPRSARALGARAHPHTASRPCSFMCSSWTVRVGGM